MKSKSQIDRQLALAHAQWHHQILRAYLTPDENQRRRLIEEAESRLPSSLRRLYRAAADTLAKEADHNHGLMAWRAGFEVNFLLEYMVRGKEQIVRDWVTAWTDRDAKYFELSPGVPLLSVSADTYAKFKTWGLVEASSGASAFVNGGRYEPKFMVVPRLNVDPVGTSDPGNAYSTEYLTHETHHLLWAMLRQAHFFRRRSAIDPLEMFPDGFRWFADELAAYSITGRGVGAASPYYMVYDNDPALLEQADQLKRLAMVATNIAGVDGLDGSILAWAGMTSKNFAGLEQRLNSLLARKGELKPADFQLFGRLPVTEVDLRRIAEQNELRVSEATVVEAILAAVRPKMGQCLFVLDDVRRRINGIASVAETICGRPLAIDRRAVAVQLFEESGWPQEVAVLVANAPAALDRYIILGRPLQRMAVRLLNSDVDLESPEVWEFSRNLMNTNDVMRATLKFFLAYESGTHRSAFRTALLSCSSYDEACWFADRAQEQSTIDEIN